MSIATLAAYKTALDQGEKIAVPVIASTVVTARPYDLWRVFVPVGAVPTSPEAPTSATLGSLIFQNGGTGTLAILGSRWTGINYGQIIIADRLSHQAGLSGTVTGEQTTNLPTAALTRSTSGVGVMIGLTIYTAIGGTSTVATTVTVSYTNTADTAGRISPAVAIGATGFNLANRMIQIPLAAGDLGVKSVQSVTLAASTGTAGNFGVTLYKPLYVIGVESSSAVTHNTFLTGATFGLIPEIPDNACLFPIGIIGGVNAIGAGTLIVGEHS